MNLEANDCFHSLGPYCNFKSPIYSYTHIHQINRMPYTCNCLWDKQKTREYHDIKVCVLSLRCTNRIITINIYHRWATGLFDFKWKMITNSIDENLGKPCFSLSCHMINHSYGLGLPKCVVYCQHLQEIVYYQQSSYLVNNYSFWLYIIVYYMNMQSYRWFQSYQIA